MKSNVNWSTLFFALLVLPFFGATYANAPTPSIVASEPKLTAKAYLLIDFDSGKVLAEKNADQKVEPASLTKIMTGYVVFNELKNGNIKMEDKVTISKKAWKMPGSKMFIEVGKKVTVENLIKGMVVQSGNDASVALAEHIAGSEEAFVNSMNQYAKILGMDSTNFENVTGLPSKNHYTTAHDLTKLTSALIRQFPNDYKRYEQKKFTFNGITQYNRNKLLWQDPSVDGLKTGHTKSAGYCLVASATKNNMRIISILLGTESARLRIAESQKLISYGFRFFETHKIYKSGQRLNDARVWEGQLDNVGAGLVEDLYVTVPRGQYKNLIINSELQPELKAPLEKGQTLGKLTISLHGEPLVEKPLIALSSVEEGSFIKKIMDQMKRLVENLLQMIGL